MINAKVQLDNDVLEALTDQIRQSPRLMQTNIRRTLVRIRPQILAELKKEPGPPKYPIAWKSERQRRFVMAKLRRERNLPYKRTGQLLADYDVKLDTTDTGGVFVVTNDNPAARWVVGDDAQPFHLATGWVQVAPVVVKYDEIVTDALIDAWFTIADPKV